MKFQEYGLKHKDAEVDYHGGIIGKWHCFYRGSIMSSFRFWTDTPGVITLLLRLKKMRPRSLNSLMNN